jgi:hypothetical protein
MPILFSVLTLVLVAYAGACWYLWSYQRSFVFLPTRDFVQTPADLALPFEDVSIPVGTSPPSLLHGWWLPADVASAPVVLYLHGNDHNIGSSVEAVALLLRMEFSVLLVDYRGYGKSGGEFPTEAQVYEDAEASWNYLIRDRHADPAKTFIYGQSLGGAIAIELAARHPEAAGLIVESSFTSVADVAKIGYWMFPVDALLNERFDSLAKVAKLRIPVLYIHGTSDDETPYAMSEQLFAATPGTRKLTLIPGGGHEDSAAVGGTVYTHAMREFADSALRGR